MVGFLIHNYIDPNEMICAINTVKIQAVIPPPPCLEAPFMERKGFNLAVFVDGGGDTTTGAGGAAHTSLHVTKSKHVSGEIGKRFR